MDAITWWVLLFAAILVPLLVWVCWRMWRRRDVGPAALLLMTGALWGYVAVSSACQPQREAAERDLAAALQRTTAAVTGFVAWDRQHQLDLVRGSRTREEATAKLAAYQVQQQQTIGQIKAAAAAIGAAVAALDGRPPAPMPPPTIGAAGGGQ